MDGVTILILFVIWRFIYAIIRTCTVHSLSSKYFEVFFWEVLGTFFVPFIAGPVGVWIQEKTNYGCLGTIIWTIILIAGIIAIAAGVGPVFFLWW